MLEKSNLDELIKNINETTSGYILRLPIKPNTMIFIVNEIRHLFEKVDENLIPKNCANYYTETCCDCPFLEKECKKVGIPQKVWFYLDSPYITFVQNYWGESAFDNLEDCLNACHKKYGEELVNKLIEHLTKIEGDKIEEQKD